ncbi:unnamed protein product [Rhodiola kirilowii]
MAKVKRLSSANRAWNILRLAMLWARKGSFIKRKLVMDLHQASKYLKALKKNSKEDSIRYYGEHELSFDETPMIQVKMYKPTSMRFRLPCFTPDQMVDFDCEDYCFNSNCAIEDHGNNVDQEETSCCKLYHDSDDDANDGDEQIDERAEKFIAEFYAQMKLQRQMSRLEYQ